MDEQRQNYKRYHKGLLNHLKMLKCTCKRNKKFDDNLTQTDVIPSQDAIVQCNSVGTAKSAQKKHGRDNSRKSKLSMLSVHRITESEIIRISSIAGTDKNIH